ncbi:MAG: type I DNA topoisomerase [Firmicutes bacterium]|nr:type I DNA topoisomerase [Bacillota bacterium]MDY5335723.1 type I DNA topoisomerase [Bacilli bacterium]
MSKKLVIVESPHKSKTIEKYLGKDFKVVSSVGHIRDLSTSGKYGFGVDIDNNFKPDYKIIKGKTKLVKELKKDIKNADFVYLATDPDREGEAISWHLYDTLGLKEENYDRIVFNEITKKAVLDSFNKARKIDDNLVKSQETRRILDRIIGFRLSKLMQSKTGGKSAGRVQSVALKLIVDREREIEAFIPEEYFEIEAKFNDFDAKLDTYNHKKIEIKKESEAKEILSKLSNAFKIESIDKKEKAKKSKFPFTTSTLEQEASTKLGFTSKKTMMIAQKLYEGINLKDGAEGLISYMRTDSVRLSDEFIKETYGYIKDNYGSEYVGYVKKSNKTENVQDAHEAIRPTNINNTPEKIKEYLTNDEYKLYSLIYYRALASLMKDAKVEATTVILDNNNYQFKVNGQILIFDGYLKVYSKYEDSEDKVLPDFSNYKSNVLVANTIEYTSHTTKPPARYTESKLIKEMEELGIGRPSTYAKTIDTIEERGYVKVIDKKFIPTEVGIETTDKLQEFFKDIINVEYTKNMEDDLDKIAEGNMEWNKLLSIFYQEFEPKVEVAFKNMEKKAPEETGELCPNCGSPLVIKQSKYGKFTACSNYPTCKYIKSNKEEKEVKEIISCPKCDGKILEKKTKRGKIFYGCSNYPKCDFASWDKPIEEKCPNCNGTLTEKKDKIKCMNCDYERAN